MSLLVLVWFFNLYIYGSEMILTFTLSHIYIYTCIAMIRLICILWNICSVWTFIGDSPFWMRREWSNWLLTVLLLLVSCVWWVSTTCLWWLYLAFYEWYTHVYRMSMPDVFWATLKFMSNIVHLQYHFANSDVRIYLKCSKAVKGVNLSIFNPDSQQMIHKIKRHSSFIHTIQSFPGWSSRLARHVMRCPWSYKPSRHSCRRDQSEVRGLVVRSPWYIERCACVRYGIG